MPKVIFVDETAQLGGGEINLLMIAQGLQATAWQVSIILPQPGPLATRLQAMNIPVVFITHPPFISTTYQWGYRLNIPNPFALLFSLVSGLIWMWRLYKHFRHERPDVMHTMSMWSHAFAGLAARMAGCSVVWHFQDIVNPRSGWGLYQRMVLWWARYIPQQIVCVSEQVATPFRSDQQHLLHKIKILPNAIDVQRFSAIHRPDDPENRGLFLRIGTVARLTPWKGQEVALDVARQLKLNKIPFIWAFAGDEVLGVKGYREHLQSLIQQWDLEPEVQIKGWIEDIPNFYRDLDVLVHLPTEPEPFGLVLVEAMAAGLPVITTINGGASDIVLAGGGHLVSPNQPQSVVEVLQRWWQEGDELRERGNSSRAFVTNGFDLNSYVLQLTTLYELLTP